MTTKLPRAFSFVPVALLMGAELGYAQVICSEGAMWKGGKLEEIGPGGGDKTGRRTGR